jgi:hypothetical protein
MSAAFVVPAFSQQPATASQQPATSATAQPAQDETQAKTDLYSRFRDNVKKDQAAAYELGKEYLQKYSTPEDEIVKYIKNFVAKYEAALPAYTFGKLLEEKKFPEAFAAGKTVLAKNPDDLKTLIGVSWAGMYGTLSGKQELAADAQTYTKKTIDLINAGKTPEPNGQFTNKDETLGWLHYALGYYNLKNTPSEAANYLYKSASYEGSSKKDPQTYAWLAAAYQSGDYNRLSKEYTDKCAGKAENPECKAMLETTNQVIDKIIDAYARAIAYAKISPDPTRYAQAMATWQKDLTDFYKFRHNDSDTGLNDYIAGIAGKPMPTPAITPVAPASTTPTTGSTGAGATTDTTGGSTTTAQPQTGSGTKTTTTSTTTSTTTRATGTTTAPASSGGTKPAGAKPGTTTATRP